MEIYQWSLSSRIILRHIFIHDGSRRIKLRNILSTITPRLQITLIAVLVASVRERSLSGFLEQISSSLKPYRVQYHKKILSRINMIYIRAVTEFNGLLHN